MTELYTTPKKKIVYLAQCKLLLVINIIHALHVGVSMKKKIILVVFCCLFSLFVLLAVIILGDMQIKIFRIEYWHVAMEYI